MTRLSLAARFCGFLKPVRRGFLLLGVAHDELHSSSCALPCAGFGGLQKFEAMPFGCEDANSADPALTVTRSNQENDSATTANSHFYKRNSANDRRTEDLDAATGLRSLDSDCIRPHSQHQGMYFDDAPRVFPD
jgi:hypothetical protein